MRLLVAASVVVLALTGCAPNIDRQWKNCVETYTPGYRLEGLDEIDAAAAAAADCDAELEEDRGRFVIVWDF